MSKSILILGTSTVQAEAVEVCHLLGLETHVCSNSGLGPAGSLAEYTAKIDITNITGVLEYVRREEIGLVYSVGSDLAMPTASRVCQQLGLPAFVSAETAVSCNSKPRLRQILGPAFPGNLCYQVLTEPDPAPVNLPYPLMLKPADSQGGRGVSRVDSEADFVTSFAQAISFSREGRVILEEYIPGPEFSLNLYLLDGEIVFSALSERQVWPQFKVGLVHRHRFPVRGLAESARQELLQMASAACRRLDILNGPAYFQVKRWQGQFFLIEITPRLDGCHLWRLIREATGVDLLRITFEHLLGHAPKAADFGQNLRGEYLLEFLCQPPGEPALPVQFPADVLHADTYYTPGEPVRRINGLLEKTAYFIQQMPGQEEA